jgi:hypothetical protein
MTRSFLHSLLEGLFPPILHFLEIRLSRAFLLTGHGPTSNPHHTMDIPVNTPWSQNLKYCWLLSDAITSTSDMQDTIVTPAQTGIATSDSDVGGAINDNGEFMRKETLCMQFLVCTEIGTSQKLPVQHLLPLQKITLHLSFFSTSTVQPIIKIYNMSLYLRAPRFLQQLTTHLI